MSVFLFPDNTVLCNSEDHGAAHVDGLDAHAEDGGDRLVGVPLGHKPRCLYLSGLQILARVVLSTLRQQWQQGYLDLVVEHVAPVGVYLLAAKVFAESAKSAGVAITPFCVVRMSMGMVICGAVTYVIGFTGKNYCEQGATMSRADMRRAFKRNLDEGAALHPHRPPIDSTSSLLRNCQCSDLRGLYNHDQVRPTLTA